jgi:hypothetical protein
MQKTSTLKPFATGDIFLGNTYLNDPNDDHRGEGRIIQFDRNWVMKGTWYTTGTRYFIVGCKIAPDDTLWGFDCHDHIAVRATPDGKELAPWDSGRSFGSVNWDREGNHYFGEYLIGTEIWKGTSAKLLADGTLGDGRIYQYSPDLKPIKSFRVENAPEPTRFKGVTHSAMHPSGEFITYTTETSRRLMRYDIRNDRQMPDLAAYTDADPFDRSDRRWFIAPAYLADGRLLCTDATGLAIYDEEGKMLRHIDLPGYGWAQVAPDVDERYAVAANVWTGVAARIDLKEEKILQQMDTGFTAPFRSLAGLAVFRG